jgi:hypothetical protein
MSRLTAKDKELICAMCTIAESQGRDDDGKGEGDYAEWTEEDFKRADDIFEKVCNIKAFARQLRGGAK